MIPTLLRTALVLLLLLPAGAFAQAVPDASRLSGHFKVAGNDDAGEVNIYLHDVNTYYVRLGKTWFKVTRGSESEDTLKGGVEQPGDVSSTIQSGADDALAGIFNGNTSGGSQANSGSTLEIKVAELNRYEATIARGSEKKRFTLQRALMRKPASGYDRGPRGALARHLREAPKYPNTGMFERVFWDDWGPVFYRGRLNGTARLLCIASDPGPTEGMPFVRRSLVGDAGQRVQGFMEKLGITESYTLVNAFTYPTRPSRISVGRKLMTEVPEQLKWRNDFYDMLYSKNKLEAIVLFGGQSTKAFDMWNESRQARGLPDVRQEVTVVDVYHPSGGRDWTSNVRLAEGWRVAITALRKVVTPDDESLANQPNFGQVFSEIDYAEIPSSDLPSRARSYPWIMDNSWSRNVAKGRRNNSVKRIGRLNMEFDNPDGSRTYYRVVGPNARNHNWTPRYRGFDDLQSIAKFALNDFYGDDRYDARVNATSGIPRLKNVLKALDLDDTKEAITERVESQLLSAN